MNTSIQRPAAVTALIDTDSTPAPAAYTATVYMNSARRSFEGHQPCHLLAEATRPDGSPLCLVFYAGDRIRGHETAAEAAFEVGIHQGQDDNGQTWPADIRSVSVGDVIKVTSPDHWIIHLRVDSTGFSAVPEPAHLTGIAGPRAVGRR
ncbi:hypothetical protein [Streptomyces sp. NPDC053755]|uniref:hypothetical protein n=1 Tax=Streptomyces sp. NPDC053755 TaxID=3155815 RepID=UPI00343E8E6F